MAATGQDKLTNKPLLSSSQSYKRNFSPWNSIMMVLSYWMLSINAFETQDLFHSYRKMDILIHGSSPTYILLLLNHTQNHTQNHTLTYREVFRNLGTVNWLITQLWLAKAQHSAVNDILKTRNIISINKMNIFLLPSFFTTNNFKLFYHKHIQLKTSK